MITARQLPQPNSLEENTAANDDASADKSGEAALYKGDWPVKAGGSMGTTIAGLIWIFGFGGGIVPLLLCAIIIAPLLSALFALVFAGICVLGMKKYTDKQ